MKKINKEVIYSMRDIMMYLNSVCSSIEIIQKNGSKIKDYKLHEAINRLRVEAHECRDYLDDRINSD
jgi:hypothetical protein